MSQVKLSQLKAKHTKERQIKTLCRAYAKTYKMSVDEPLVEKAADEAYRVVHAIVFAVLPGRQSSKNALPAFNQGIQAMARAIRRRA